MNDKKEKTDKDKIKTIAKIVVGGIIIPGGFLIIGGYLLHKLYKAKKEEKEGNK